jgi:hypothetical protein
MSQCTSTQHKNKKIKLNLKNINLNELVKRNEVGMYISQAFPVVQQ